MTATLSIAGGLAIIAGFLGAAFGAPSGVAWRLVLFGIVLIAFAMIMPPRPEHPEREP